jgi:hypothetical protein
MVTESERVSSELGLDMTNVAAQEDAALLFATLALREYSGNFYDNHRSLCRLAIECGWSVVPYRIPTGPIWPCL